MFHSSWPLTISCLVFEQGIWSQLQIGLNLILVGINKKEQAYLPQKVVLKINKLMYAKHLAQGQAHSKRYKTSIYYYNWTVICIIHLLKHWEVACHHVCNLHSKVWERKNIYIHIGRKIQMLTNSDIRWRVYRCLLQHFFQVFHRFEVFKLKKWEENVN